MGGLETPYKPCVCIYIFTDVFTVHHIVFSSLEKERDITVAFQTFFSSSTKGILHIINLGQLYRKQSCPPDVNHCIMLITVQPKGHPS